MIKNIAIITATLTSLLFSSVTAKNVNSFDYCTLNCPDEQHTMCKYTKSEPSKACLDVRRTGLTKAEKQSIVNLHNKLRQNVASGKEKRGNPGPQPPAKHMPNLEWDEELELIAQRWTNQCDDNHDCCTVARFEVGQNIAEDASSDDDCTIESLVQSWYDEVQFFNSNDVPSFVYGGNGDGEDVEHYTQLVWDKTTKIGCGFIKYIKEGLFVTSLICNYGESGNFGDEPVYEKK